MHSYMDICMRACVRLHWEWLACIENCMYELCQEQAISFSQQVIIECEQPHLSR